MKQRFEVRKHGAILGYVLERPSGFWFNSRCQHGNSRRGWATPELAVAKLPEVTLHQVGWNTWKVPTLHKVENKDE